VSPPDGGTLSDKKSVSEVRQVKEEDANFVLFVLNASQKSRSQEIQVRIDDNLAVDDTFSSEVSDPLMSSIPTTKVFYFRLTPGPHTLAAATGGSDAVLEERFDLTDGKRWALLGYEYWSGAPPQPPPGRFRLIVQDTPIYFQ
jgi:hypothetical protein